MNRKWYKGDTHLHTVNSDGDLTLGQLVEKGKNKGLDFMIITDHNYNTVDESYYDGDMLVIQGQEITDEMAHINVWGVKVPEDPPYVLNDAEDYKKLVKKCKDAGGIISANHPFCSMCGFQISLDNFKFDCVEVWNTVQHSDNMKNRDWWVDKLLKGEKISAVGGSDYHRDVAKLPILAMPTTYVHAKSNTEKDILEAIKEGRCVVTNSPSSSMINLSYGNCGIGDTGSLADGHKLRVAVTNMMIGHTLKIYNNDKVIFETKANKNAKLYMTAVDVKEAGFVRAEITYKFPAGIKKIYKLVEKKFLDCKDNFIPDFIWAFTNPIWIKE